MGGGRFRPRGHRAPGGAPPDPRGAAVVPVESDLWAPGLVLLATASIFQGYKWLGAIPSSHSHLSRILFSQAGAVAVAGLSLLGVVVLNGSAGIRARAGNRRALLVAAAAAVASSLVLAVFDTGVTRSSFGVIDLVLALTAVATLVPAERHALHGRRESRVGKGTGAVRVDPGRSPANPLHSGLSTR